MDSNENNANRPSWDSNRIMGVSAVFISLLSLFAVIYQSFLAREENDLMRIQQSASVLPYLSHWKSDGVGEFKLVIANKGVGPAFIKKVAFSATNYNTGDSIVFDNSDDWVSYMLQHSELFHSVKWTTTTFTTHSMLSQQEISQVFVISYDRESRGNLNGQLREEYAKFNVHFDITYEDVYGAAWRFNSKDAIPEKIPIK